TAGLEPRFERPRRLSYRLLGPVVEEIGADDQVEAAVRHLLGKPSPLATHLRKRCDAFACASDRLRRDVDGQQRAAPRREHLREDTDRAGELERRSERPLTASRERAPVALKLLLTLAVVPRLLRPAVPALKERRVARERGATQV